MYVIFSRVKTGIRHHAPWNASTVFGVLLMPLKWPTHEKREIYHTYVSIISVSRGFVDSSCIGWIVENGPVREQVSDMELSWTGQQVRRRPLSLSNIGPCCTMRHRGSSYILLL